MNTKMAVIKSEMGVAELDNITSEGELRYCRSMQIKFNLIWFNSCNIKQTLNQIAYGEQLKWIDFTAR